MQNILVNNNLISILEVFTKRWSSDVSLAAQSYIASKRLIRIEGCNQTKKYSANHKGYADHTSHIGQGNSEKVKRSKRSNIQIKQS